MEMQGPDGTRYPMAGEFDEVDEPRRLSYVARPLGADGEALFSLMMTLTLDATDHGSRLTVDAVVLNAWTWRPLPTWPGSSPAGARPPPSSTGCWPVAETTHQRGSTMNDTQTVQDAPVGMPTPDPRCGR